MTAREVMSPFAAAPPSRPIGIALISVAFGTAALLLLVMEIVLLLDDPYDHFVTPWDIGWYGEFYVVVAVITLSSAFGLLRRNRLARFGLLIGVTSYVIASPLGTSIGVFELINEDPRYSLATPRVMWYAIGAPAAWVVLSVTIGWYLFGRRTRAYFTKPTSNTSLGRTRER